MFFMALFLMLPLTTGLYKESSMETMRRNVASLALLLAGLVAGWMPSHAWAATANNQNNSVYQYSKDNNIYLNGSGTSWTLVTGPSNGTLSITDSICRTGRRRIVLRSR